MVNLFSPVVVPDYNCWSTSKEHAWPSLLWCSFPFLFFYALFAHWSKSAVFCCSFHRHSMCAFPHYSHVFVPCGGTCSLFSCPLPFSCPFLLWCSFPFLFFYALLAHWSKSAVFFCSFHGHPMRFFAHYSHVFVPVGGPVPFSRVFFPFLVLFSYVLWCSFPFLLCLVCPLI